MIEGVIDCQTRIIAALDAQDADAILSATVALEHAVEALRHQPNPVAPERLAHGLKQAEAARIRVKYLTAWNRQKIDRLAECRGQTSSITYAKASNRC
jgi:hypothetical protein